jgi:hypothetical protein
MEGDKWIEVIDIPQMHFRQDAKLCYRVRISNSKDSHRCENSPWQCFQLTKEYKSIQVSDRNQMHVHQEQKSYHLA